MGYRCYVCSKYDVKHQGGIFNHKSEELAELLLSHGMAYVSEDYSTIEINKDVLNQIISELETDDELLQHYQHKLNTKNLIEDLKFFLRRGDKKLDYVRLEWF